MCGIFGIISTSSIIKKDLEFLIKHAEQRGKDSSGLITFNALCYKIFRSDEPVFNLFKSIDWQQRKH